MTRGITALVMALTIGCQSPPTTPIRPASAFIQVDPGISEAPDIAATLVPYRTELAARFSRVLAQCPDGLNRSKPLIPLGQWITDTMRARATSLLGAEVQVAVTNSGGLRVDLPPGPITLRHIYEIFPFENTLVVGELKGSELQRFAVELAQTGEPFSGVFIRVSGPRSAPNLEDLRLLGGAPIDPNRTYLVATTEYLVASGDRTPMIRMLRNVKSLSITLRQVAIDAVEVLGHAGQPLAHVPETRLMRPPDWVNERTQPGRGDR